MHSLYATSQRVGQPCWLLPSVTIHHYSINRYVCTVIVFVSVGLTAFHTPFPFTDSDYPFGIFKLFLPGYITSISEIILNFLKLVET